MPTVSGTVKDIEGTGVPGRIVRLYRRDTGALIGSSITSDGSLTPKGSYIIDTNGYSGECNLIELDDPSGEIYNDLIHRTVTV